MPQNCGFEGCRGLQRVPASVFRTIWGQPLFEAFGRDWPRFGAIWARSATPEKPYIHARIPRITVVAKDQLPQIIIIIIIIIIQFNSIHNFAQPLAPSYCWLGGWG